MNLSRECQFSQVHGVFVVLMRIKDQLAYQSINQFY